jgi:hypothetical protein
LRPRSLRNRRPRRQNRSCPSRLPPLLLLTRRLGLYGNSGKGVVLDRFWPAKRAIWRIGCHKILKSDPPGLSKAGGHWYIPPATLKALAKGCLLRKPLDGSAPLGRCLSRFGFSKGAHGFIAGWSSPVARQAHNLKVIGSNPIPATKADLLSALFEKAALRGGFLLFKNRHGVTG